MKRVKIIVIGKVQGVFYRASTLEKAQQLGLTGIVKNQADGTVYIEAEGESERLEQLVIWCKSGPRFASVRTVDTEEISLQNSSKFEIVR